MLDVRPVVLRLHSMSQRKKLEPSLQPTVAVRNDPRLKTQRWLRTRQRILMRDHWVCGYCGAPANTVDHRIRREDGGAMFDPENLVACCADCQHVSVRQARTFLLRGVAADAPSAANLSLFDPHSG
jgi:5-methylcytosine-specific restriction endonuclease McrA